MDSDGTYLSGCEAIWGLGLVVLASVRADLLCRNTPKEGEGQHNLAWEPGGRVSSKGLTLMLYANHITAL